MWWTLLMDEVPHYDKLKEAILDRYGYTKDQFQLCFFAIKYTAGRGHRLSTQWADGKLLPGLPIYGVRPYGDL